MTEITDFIIVGAGVYGAATAWHLARRGATVTVIDEKYIASRASGGPGRRGVRANGRDRRELALMERAYSVWPSLHECLGTEPFYERCGHLLLAESETETKGLKARAWMQQMQGIETHFLRGDEAREREPYLSRKVKAALYCPHDGVANHSATTKAYADAAKKLGVTFLISTQIEGLEVNNSRARSAVTADGTRYAAKRGIVILANSGVLPIIKPWQSLPVWDECLQILISAPLEQVPFKHLTGHIGRTVSLKTHGDNRVMISGGWHGIWDPITNTGRAENLAIQGNLEEALAVYPALKGLSVEISNANHLETFTPDNIPIIDQLAPFDNVWYATGWCGHGWAIAPVVSKDLATWIMAGECPKDLSPFRLSRFNQPCR